MATVATTDAVNALRADLLALDHAVRASHELRVFLHSPIINIEKKKAALTTAFQSAVGPASVEFLRILCDRRHEALLPAIIKEFGAQYDRRMNISRPVVRSAVALTTEQQQSLERTLSAQLGMTITPKYLVDPAVIGGMSVCIGDTMVDGTVVHQLETLRASLQKDVG